MTNHKLTSTILLLLFIFLSWTPLFGQENHRESIGFHILDSSFNSIFYSDTLIELPNSVCLKGEYLEYLYPSLEDGKLFAEIIDLPRAKSRGAYAINRLSPLLGLSQKGSYYRGFGILNSSDVTCLNPWGSSWTKLDSLGHELFHRTERLDENDFFVREMRVKWEGEKAVDKKNKTTFGSLGDECNTYTLSRPLKYIEITNETTNELVYTAWDENDRALEYEQTFTTQTNAWTSTWSRKDNPDGVFVKQGPYFKKSTTNEQIDAYWGFNEIRESCSNKDERGIVVGGHPSFPNSTFVTFDLNQMSADEKFSKKDYRISAKVNQDWVEGDRVTYEFLATYYFASDWSLNVHVDYDDWPNPTVTCVLFARGMEVAKKKTVRDGESLDMWTNTSSIDINQIGETFYVSLNSSIIFSEDVSLTPTGQIAFWNWSGERFRGNSKYSDPNYRSYVENAEITFFDIQKPRNEAVHSDETPSNTIIGSGSGVVIDASNGYIITNYHVVEGSSGLLAEIAGTQYKAQTVRTDANNDLALIQVEEIGRQEIAALPIKMTAGLGSKVFSAGFPKLSTMGKDIKVTEGIISSVSFLDDPSKFQISCPITNGNSGGALLDELGNLIGITQGGYRPDENTENVNAAVKSIYVLALAQSQSDCVITTTLNHGSIDFGQLQFSVIPILIQE